MPKRRKAWSCALKAWNPARNAHSAKADPASAIADFASHSSATMKATAAMEAGATRVTTTTTTVVSRPCYGA
jgi:hypothetical protein